MASKKTHLSRYDAERVFGEMIQLHFNSYDSAKEWAIERFAEKLRVSESHIRNDIKLVMLASDLAELLQIFDETISVLYLPQTTPD